MMPNSADENLKNISCKIVKRLQNEKFTEDDCKQLSKDLNKFLEILKKLGIILTVANEAIKLIMELQQR